MRNRIRFWKWAAVSDQEELENKKYLCTLIAKEIDFSQ
jgi:hypothetical protein